MKKIILMVSAAMLGIGCAIALAACGGDGTASAPTATATQTATEPVETEIGATETDAETVTETTETETSPPAPAVRTIRIVVENATPRGGIARPTVERGERVVLVVRSDVADEVHLHGYDVSRAVVAGGTVRLPFTATLSGRFEVELEERGVVLAEVTVR